MTNFEKIIAPLQTATGLALFLMGTGDDWCVYCGNQAKCIQLLDSDTEVLESFCAKHIMQWLESETAEVFP